MGAYYFDNQDTAILPFVGLTRKEVTSGVSTLSAFVEYSEYPITFDEGGFQFVWQNGASFDNDRASPTYRNKCGPTANPYGGPRESFGPPMGVERMVLTSYVWLYEAIANEPFAPGAPPPPPPPFAQWGPTPPPPPCPLADCSGVMHGRNWGGPATNGTANGTGVATATAAACSALCVADKQCRCVSATLLFGHTSHRQCMMHSAFPYPFFACLCRVSTIVCLVRSCVYAYASPGTLLAAP
jgi:hypothetical protein